MVTLRQSGLSLALAVAIVVSCAAAEQEERARWSDNGCEVKMEDPNDKGRMIWGVMDIYSDNEFDDFCGSPCGCHPSTYPSLSPTYGIHPPNQYGGFLGNSPGVPPKGPFIVDPNPPTIPYPGYYNPDKPTYPIVQPLRPQPDVVLPPTYPAIQPPRPDPLIPPTYPAIQPPRPKPDLVPVVSTGSSYEQGSSQKESSSVHLEAQNTKENSQYSGSHEGVVNVGILGLRPVIGPSFSDEHVSSTSENNKVNVNLNNNSANSQYSQGTSSSSDYVPHPAPSVPGGATSAYEKGSSNTQGSSLDINSKHNKDYQGSVVSAPYVPPRGPGTPPLIGSSTFEQGSHSSESNKVGIKESSSSSNSQYEKGSSTVGVVPGRPVYPPGPGYQTTNSFEKGGSSSQSSSSELNVENKKESSGYSAGSSVVSAPRPPTYPTTNSGSTFETGSHSSESNKVGIKESSSSSSNQFEKGSSTVGVVPGGPVYPSGPGYQATNSFEKGGSSSQSSSSELNVENKKESSGYSAGSSVVSAPRPPTYPAPYSGSSFEQGSHSSESNKVGIKESSSSSNSQYEKGSSTVGVVPGRPVYPPGPGYQATNSFEKGGSSSQSSSLDLNVENKKESSGYSAGSSVVSAPRPPTYPAPYSGSSFEQGSHSSESNKVGIKESSSSSSNQFEKGSSTVGITPGRPVYPSGPGYQATNSFEKGGSSSQSSSLDLNVENKKESSGYSAGSSVVSAPRPPTYPTTNSGSTFEQGSHSSESNKVGIKESSSSSNSQFEKGSSSVGVNNLPLYPARPLVPTPGVVTNSAFEKGSSNSQSSSLDVNEEHKKENSQYSKGSSGVVVNANPGPIPPHIPHSPVPGVVTGSSFEQGSHSSESNKVNLHSDSSSSNSQFEKGSSSVGVNNLPVYPARPLVPTPGVVTSSAFEKGSSNSQSSSLDLNEEHKKENSQYSKGTTSGSIVSPPRVPHPIPVTPYTQPARPQTDPIPPPGYIAPGRPQVSPPSRPVPVQPNHLANSFEQGSHSSQSDKVGVHASSSSSNSQYEKGSSSVGTVGGRPQPTPEFPIRTSPPVVSYGNAVNEKGSSSKESSSLDLNVEHKKEEAQFSKGSSSVSNIPLQPPQYITPGQYPPGQNPPPQRAPSPAQRIPAQTHGPYDTTFEQGSHNSESNKLNLHSSSGSTNSQFEKGSSSVGVNAVPLIHTRPLLPTPAVVSNSAYEKGSSNSQSSSLDLNQEHKKEGSQYSKGTSKDVAYVNPGTIPMYVRPPPLPLNSGSSFETGSHSSETNKVGVQVGTTSSQSQFEKGSSAVAGVTPGRPLTHGVVAGSSHEKGSSSSQSSSLAVDLEHKNENSQFSAGSNVISTVPGVVPRPHGAVAVGSSFEQGSHTSESNKVGVKATATSATSQYEKGSSGISKRPLNLHPTASGALATSTNEKGSSSSQSSSLDLSEEHKKQNSQFAKESSIARPQVLPPRPLGAVAVGSSFEQGSHNSESSKVGVKVATNSAQNNFEKTSSGVVAVPLLSQRPGGIATGASYAKGSSSSQTSNLAVDLDSKKESSQFTKGSTNLVGSHVPYHGAVAVGGSSYETGSHSAESNKVGVKVATSSAQNNYEKGSSSSVVGRPVITPGVLASGNSHEKGSSSSQSSSVDVNLENKNENSNFAKGSTVASSRPYGSSVGVPIGSASSFEQGQHSSESSKVGVKVNTASANSNFEKGSSSLASGRPVGFGGTSSHETGSSSSQGTSVEVNLENSADNSQFQKATSLLGSGSGGLTSSGVTGSQSSSSNKVGVKVATNSAHSETEKASTSSGFVLPPRVPGTSPLTQIPVSAGSFEGASTSSQHSKSEKKSSSSSSHKESSDSSVSSSNISGNIPLSASLQNINAVKNQQSSSSSSSSEESSSVQESSSSTIKKAVAVSGRTLSSDSANKPFFYYSYH